MLTKVKLFSFASGISGLLIVVSLLTGCAKQKTLSLQDGKKTPDQQSGVFLPPTLQELRGMQNSSSSGEVAQDHSNQNVIGATQKKMGHSMRQSRSRGNKGLLNSTSVNKSYNLAQSKMHRGRVHSASEQQAKMSDIPLPLGAQAKSMLKDPNFGLHDTVGNESANAKINNVTLAYFSSIGMDDLIAFYTLEMERLGWRMIASCAGFEALLVFEKPQRYCAVSIRPYQSKRQHGHDLVICTGETVKGHA